ncbi:MAG: hypothetical protein Q7S21_02735 [archaeon]|nr:hypothetical protein [archaeon]
MIDLSETTLESPLAIAISISGSNYNKKIGKAKISFKKDQVIVNAIQGTKGKSKELREFEEIVSMPWAHYLITELENQARENGYKIVKIVRPEKMIYNIESRYMKESIHKDQFLMFTKK